MKNQAKQIIYTLIGVVAVVAVWWIAAAVYGKPVLLPTPIEALKELWSELSSSLFWRSFLGSVLRSLIGFTAACLLAVICAYGVKAFKPLRYVLSPVIGVLRSVPTMSVILLLVLWVDRQINPVIVTGLVIFPVLYSGLDAALSTVGNELEETARMYAPSVSYRFTKVYLPLSAPAFLRVAGGAAALSLKLTVAAEVLAQTRESLGMLMQQTRLYFQIGRLMALTVAVVVASLVIEGVFYFIRRAFDYE